MATKRALLVDTSMALVVTSVIWSLVGCSSVTKYHVEVKPQTAGPKTTIPSTGVLSKDIPEWINSGFEFTVEPKHLYCVYKVGKEKDPFDGVLGSIKLRVDYGAVARQGRGSGLQADLRTMAAYSKELRKHCSPESESKPDYARYYSELLRRKAKAYAPEYVANLGSILKFSKLSEFDTPDSDAESRPKDLNMFVAWLMKAARATLKGKLLGMNAELSFQAYHDVMVINLMDDQDKKNYEGIVKKMSEIYDIFSCNFGPHEMITYDAGFESKLTHLDRIAYWRVGNLDMTLVEHAEDGRGGNVKVLFWPHNKRSTNEQVLCRAIEVSNKLSRVDPYPSVSLACYDSMDEEISDGGTTEKHCK